MRSVLLCVVDDDDDDDDDEGEDDEGEENPHLPQPLLHQLSTTLMQVHFSDQNRKCFHFPWNDSSLVVRGRRRELGLNGTPRKNSLLS